MDDYFIDDILTNFSDKKKVNSKDKGIRGESGLCKVLTARFGESFFRVVGSGNRWSQVNMTENAKNVLNGDVVCPEHFKFTIECKYGYADIDLSAAFENGSKEIDKFIEQTEKAATRTGKHPMLCWRKPHKKWLAFVKDDIFPDSCLYKLYYRDWVVSSLSELLRKDDSFFFQQSSSQPYPAKH